MRFPRLKFVLILVIAIGSAYASELQRVKLTDGSVLNVEVISMHNGVYTFKSPSLGELRINAKQVQSISSSSVSTPQARSSNINPTQLQSTLKAKPGTMKLISGLKDDPDVRAILSDPKIMKAIHNGDYSALANSPKFRKLMENPKIKQITGSVTQ